MRVLLCCAAIALAGCATQQAHVETVTVKVPVPTPCLRGVQIPPRPAIKTDAELAALPDYQLVLEGFAERADLVVFTGELEAILKACR